MAIFQKENENELRVEETKSTVISIPALKGKKEHLLEEKRSRVELHRVYLDEVNAQIAEINNLLDEARNVGIDISKIEPVLIDTLSVNEAIQPI